jgi:hypothetical protein
MNNKWLEQTMKIRLPIILGVALITYVLTFYISAPERTGIGRAPEQPIPFSHAKHAGEMKIDCRYCHIGVEKGRHATIPSLNICMNCHTEAKTESPHIKKLTKHYEENIPLAWNRVYRVPEYVYFDHSVHIAKGFDCVQCHGDVASMDKVEQVERVTMGKCVKCHEGAHKEQPGISAQDVGPKNCSVCHR